MKNMIYPVIYQRAFRLFPYLTIVNNASINIRVHIFFFELVFSISLDKYPGVGLLDHRVVSFSFTQWSITQS